nr:hypothetical protein [uncultured Sphaerochaeta sp.]
MEHFIISAIALKYTILSESEQEAKKVVDTFTSDRIHGGNRPEEFSSEFGFNNSEGVSYHWSNTNIFVVYQSLEIVTYVERRLSDNEFLALFSEYIKENYKLRYDVENIDNLLDITILDHVVLRRETIKAIESPHNPKK